MEIFKGNNNNEIFSIKNGKFVQDSMNINL